MDSQFALQKAGSEPAFFIPNESLCTIVGASAMRSTEPMFCHVKAGQTIAQMLGNNVAHSVMVSVGGEAIPRELWDRVRPKAGQTIHATIYPQGGGNGSKWIRTVALVALIVVANVYGGAVVGALGLTGTTASAVGGALISVVGSLAINALVPPPSPKAGAAGDPYSQLASLTGTSNQATPYGVIPCVMGQMRFYPPHAALPYTEISGDDQYLRMMLDLGYGDLDISDIQIGETPIDSFDDVEYEITTSPSLFTQDIFELQVGTTLNNDGDIDTRTTQDQVTEASVDLIFPAGLFGVNKRGKSVSAWVYVDVTFRKVGTTTWYGIYDQDGLSLSTPSATVDHALNRIKIDSAAQKTLRVGVRWKLPVGQYEISVKRLGTGWDDSSQQVTGMVWSTLRSISPQNPSTTGTLKLALRIKATDQLQGVVSTLSVLAAQRVRTYDPGAGTFGDPIATQNPAWIWLWLLTECPAVVRRLATSRIDLPAVAAWAAECESKGLVISQVMDQARSLDDIQRDVLSAGRASPGMRNGKYSPVRDLPQAVPVQMFTPANSWGFSYSRSFADPPHALRVKFINPEASYQEDTRTVYWDGYNAGNATRFEELDLRLVPDPAAVWRLARYHLAVMWLRQTQYVFNADIEHMVCERGDLVHVAHDITQYGLAWGRIKAISADGLTITLDESPLELEAGKTYTLRVRRNTNTQVSGDLDTTGLGLTWDSTTVTFDNTMITFDEGGTSFPVLHLSEPLAGIHVGDLYVMGETSREVAKLIIRRIEPSNDLTARITCVDAAPDVWTSDNGMPPAFVSTINGKSWCEAPPVPHLTIRIGRSSPDDVGSMHAQVGVSVSANSGIYRLPLYKRQQLGFDI